MSSVEVSWFEALMLLLLQLVGLVGDVAGWWLRLPHSPGHLAGSCHVSEV